MVDELLSWSYFCAFLVGYVMGSVPFGLLLALVSGAGDIRKIGSGNIGATNVLRTGRKALALTTLVLDGVKAGGAFLIIDHFWGFGPGLAAGGFAFLGHCFPIWLRFKGGKGVATYLGLLFAVSWPFALAAGLCWLVVAFVYRYSSLAALVMTGLVPPVALFLNLYEVAVVASMMTVVLFWRHHENFTRLQQGSEPKIGNSWSFTKPAPI